MIWNEPMECMPREELRRLQGERLRATVERVYHGTPFYRRKMQAAGVAPDDIRYAEDVVKLPFTTKDDLRDNYPYGLFAAPMSQIVRLHASSGTTGNPTVVGYTRCDLQAWAEMVARALTAYGASGDDIFSVAYGYGLFTGGLGLHYGVEHLGGVVIPMSSGNTRKQVQLMRDFGPTGLACTPSYALYLGEAMRDSGYPRSDFRLRIGAFGAEPWSEGMRAEIEQLLGIKAYDIYGLSEIMGPGVSHECQYQHGSHIHEDHFIAEIIDPQTLEPLPHGVPGELVFTTITKEGLPLLRYRTKDLTSLIADPCPCGRTSLRMSRITGRSDDMLIIRGVNVFPSQVESVLLEMAEFTPHYLIVVDRVNNLDIMQVQVEVGPEHFSDEMSAMIELKKRLTHRLQSVLGIAADVRLVEPNTIARSEGKARRVVDNRKL
ncbi:MAG: phenylacetate--CoA ligase [Rikenellaceae bacterium]|nr:phenylacetate--CoA ligase [Rikenellaceae bacterium]